MKNIVLLSAIALTLAACATKRTPATDAMTSATDTSGDRPAALVLDSRIPRAVIYKTKANYNDLVPVTMDEARSMIVAYPAPSDVVAGGTYARPTELAGGYLLDNRGVTSNSAFLDYTYEEYAKLNPYPTAAELLRHVVETHPFTEMYYVERPSSPDKTAYYNSVVESGFAGCERAELK